MKPPLTQNAADAQQVATAKKRERYAREQQLNDVRELLASGAGRRTLWRLLEHCQTFESIFTTSSQIYYNAGRQDVGHYLLAEISDANPTAILSLMQDAALEDQKHG